MHEPRTPAAGVTVFQSRLFQMNSALVAHGDTVALVDPGVLPDELDAIAAAVAGRAAALLVQTHWHWDHIVGQPRWPDATLLASGRYLELLSARRSEMEAAVAREIDHTAARTGAAWEPAPRLRLPDLTIGREMPVGPLLPGWTAIPVPGHTPDMLALFHEEAGVCLCADLGSDIEPPTLDGPSDEFLTSLDRLLALPITTLVPGHGSIAEGRDAARRRLEFDRTYLAGLREAIAGALARGVSIDDVHGLTVKVPGALDYPGEHQWNVLQVWKEMGGTVPDETAGR